jgi:hypothetical protein
LIKIPTSLLQVTTSINNNLKCLNPKILSVSTNPSTYSKTNVRSWKNIILNKGSKFLVGMEGGRKEALKRRKKWKEQNWALRKRAKHEENQKVVLHYLFNYSLELVQAFISF